VSRSTILVLHLAGQYPLGGIGWQAIHHLVGLQRLGHDVYYVEDSGAPPYDPHARKLAEDPSSTVAALARTMERIGFGERWAYHDVSGGRCYGTSLARLRELYRRADALLNVCGATWLREEHLRVPLRLYVQTDPVLDQVKVARGERSAISALEAHTHHFTYGENFGSPDCPVPLLRFTWRPTRPPVVVDLWEPRFTPKAPHFTTVGTWHNPGRDVILDGQRYVWSKHGNFDRFIDLPRHTTQTFELALEFYNLEDAARYRAHGWAVVDPYPRSRDLEIYQEYVGSSRGEFTVAKDVVARTRCGWFSDRSASYLAAGKPVITQDTGFGKFIPTGQGLFAFGTMDEIVAAIDQINADPSAHCRAARELACEYFDAERVLGRMLAEVGLG